MRKLKERWEINSNLQLLTIFIAFGVTGSTAAKFGEPLTLLIGINHDDILFWPVRLLIILPIYKVILLIVGWLYGEFDFFWKFEKRMFRKMGLRFVKV